MNTLSVRAAVTDDLPILTDIWHAGWHDAHASHVPVDLVNTRTKVDFQRRLEEMLNYTQAIGQTGSPLGFCTIREDELMHLFVSKSVRGKGHAIHLLNDGLTRLLSNGVKTAWLACVIGNSRAARFYEREGWVRTGEMEYLAETPSGAYPLREWRYEKKLAF